MVQINAPEPVQLPENGIVSIEFEMPEVRTYVHKNNICVLVWMYIYTYVHMYCMYRWINACMYTYVRKYLYVH